MPDDLSYSIKEMITEFRQDVKTELAEIKADGKETKAQAQKTNGRVTIAEETLKDIPGMKTEIASLKTFVTSQESVGGFFRTYLLPIVIGIVMVIVTNIITDVRTKNAISEALSTNHQQYK